MSTYLDVASVKVYLRIGQADTLDDALLAQIVDAVEAMQRARLQASIFLTVDPQMPDEVPPVVVPPDVYQAALMRASRLYARRASPEGLVPFGDLGVARIPSYDRDIDALEAPFKNVVLA